MAIVNVKDGRYIKVIREMCVFRPTSVEVFYYSFGSKKEKEDYFARKAEVERFVLRGREYYDTESELLNHEIEEYAKGAGIKKLKDISKLPLNFRERLDSLTKISKAVFSVEVGWDGARPLPQFDEKAKLIELGFDESWMNPLPSWEICSLHTGAFTNQTFTYECLYHELKKVFKDDFVDC